MMVMTAKVNIKKVLAALAAAAGVIIALILLLGGGNSSEPTAAPSVAGNDGRVQFLQNLEWQVNASPVESGQVRIPKEQNQIFTRYNDLQKSAGYDLSQYAGKTVMRYVYKVTNFPGATEPVYATLLIYKDQVIGGDITNTAADGTMQALVKRSQIPAALPDATVPETTVPESTAPVE
ncbi:MAG: DUF4830 domain-containing protein [Oscillospiraceae bacterium]|nr:DUF4830 domain-containing protein [Oscillospiraceae bacterium]